MEAFKKWEDAKIEEKKKSAHLMSQNSPQVENDATGDENFPRMRLSLAGWAFGVLGHRLLL